MNDVATINLADGSFAARLKAGIDSGEFVEITGEVEHHQTEDLYGRHFKAPKGTMLTTRVHKQDHVSVMLKGVIIVRDQDNNLTTITAPCVFTTKAGTQRAMYAVEDFEFLTVHHHTNQNLDTVKDDLTCDNIDEYKQLLIGRENV